MNTKPVLTLDTMVARSDDIVAVGVDGDIMMMSVETGKYLHLDDIASEIWKLLETPCPIREICDRLLPCYDVPRERGEADVLAFFQRACSDRFIRTLG